jgi:hypothetical protein
MGRSRGLLRARYNVLKDKTELPYRRNLINAQTEQAITLGQRMEMKKAQVRTTRTDRETRIAATRATARRLNVPQVLVSDDEDTREALALIAKSRRASSTRVQEPLTEEPS